MSIADKNLERFAQGGTNDGVHPAARRGAVGQAADLLPQFGKAPHEHAHHGFAVDVDSMKGIARLTHVNLNDQTVEGMRHRTRPIFCVQYHPEASPGPHDSTILFEEFRKLIERQS